MITVAIVDDEPIQRDALAAAVMREYGETSAGTRCDVRAFDGVAGLERFMGDHPQQPIDILLMDIQLDGTAPAKVATPVSTASDPGPTTTPATPATPTTPTSQPAAPTRETGIEAVARLFPHGSGTQVIYVTGYREYDTEVYATDHAYFLVKPVTQTSLHTALHHATARLRESMTRPIGVIAGANLHMIRPEQIVYAEQRLRVTHIHTIAKDTIHAYMKLARLREMLPDTDFAQTHKSYLVNIGKVIKSSGKELLLEDNTRIPVSQSYRHQVHESLRAYAREVLQKETEHTSTASSPTPPTPQNQLPRQNQSNSQTPPARQTQPAHSRQPLPRQHNGHGMAGYVTPPRNRAAQPSTP